MNNHNYIILSVLTLILGLAPSKKGEVLYMCYVYIAY